ncbi:hypothetical protein HDU85_002517 [Gaertneriomyces sp. JEL0708]|nr:hypothetical protein HDU85_002517 [Gaertneriomyces sp. JEL0708]
MDDLDRLLRELDATDSAVLRGALPPLPLQQATKPKSALPVAPPLLNLPTNQAVIKRVSLVPTKVAHRPSLQINAPLSQLDSLVRELTDLKELVTSDPSDELAKKSSEPSYAVAANDSKAAKLPRQPNGKRGLDATNQLDLLMGHLSRAAIDVGTDEDDADLEFDSAHIFKHESQGVNSNTGAPPEKPTGRPSTRPSITVAAEVTRQPIHDIVPPRSAEPPALKLPALPLPKSTIPPPPSQTSPLSPGPSACHNCKEPIEGPSLSALGKSFHVEHFVCSSCSRHVKHLQFHEKDGKLFCQACYALQLPNCHYCSKPITDLCVTALGKQWHPDHFFCAQCGKVFQPGSGFLEKNGMPYCEDDYNVLFAIKCGGCGKSIAGEFVSACGKEWHIPCFVCLVSFSLDMFILAGPEISNQ